LTAIVLASGGSKRFGSSKQLFEYEGESLVHRAARIAREVAPTIVVIASEDVRAALTDLDVTTVHNDEADEGMAASIRAGVRSCDGDVIITLCDQPHITASHLRALASSGAPIAATAYSGTIGVPAFFSAKFRDELLDLRGDVGAKRLLHEHRPLVAPIRFESASFDIDRRV
jgi:molybdenum cofactor cytidylyltransferase